jgi:hypothetical protein
MMNHTLVKHGAPAPVAIITVQDAAIAAAWGYSPELWFGMLTDSERRDRRDRIVFAPFFNAEGE